MKGVLRSSYHNFSQAPIETHFWKSEMKFLNKTKFLPPPSSKQPIAGQEHHSANGVCLLSKEIDSLDIGTMES
ncbi:unnamed protein product [Protopolystoma xenopodis]|uniref:Uncharacterized protein n=1 Tax=Protopolystoma xenopodis TaxID=117903 RepID=A0A3S5AA81_9PLAT|nr:unnamed protein product [Protopolystoma xenopodis]